MEYRLLSVKSRSFFVSTWSDSETFVLTYETKKWYHFGKTKIKTETVDCPDTQVSEWINSLEAKIGIWRKK